MPDPSADRPKNRETEYEDYKTRPAASPPRPATEPHGAEGSERTSKTASDPASGEDRGRPAKPQ